MVTFLLLFLIAYNGYSQTVNCGGSCNCPPSGTNTCTLQCIGTDQCKDGTLTCRSGSPCAVICDGNNACSGNSYINGRDATDVTITCTGTDACKGNTVLDCGTGDCAVTCGSSTSCESADINAPNADSFICSGSCSPASSAPAPFTAPPTPKPTTKSPTPKPTTKSPTTKPTDNPLKNPTNNPIKSPTNNPIVQPTNNPNNDPTKSPTKYPTQSPTVNPTVSPSKYPSVYPSNSPITPIPSTDPSKSPSMQSIGTTLTNSVSTPASINPSQTPIIDEQHEEVSERTESPVGDNNEVGVDADATLLSYQHLDIWVYIIMGCTVIFCCLMILLVLFKCGVIKRGKRKRFNNGMVYMENGHEQQYGQSQTYAHTSNKESNESYKPQVIGHMSPATIEGDFNSTFQSNLNNALAIISGVSHKQNIEIMTDEEISSDGDEYITAGGVVDDDDGNVKDDKVEMANIVENGYTLEGIGIDDINTGDMELLDEVDQLAEALGNDEFIIGCDEEETIKRENEDEIDMITSVDIDQFNGVMDDDIDDIPNMQGVNDEELLVMGDDGMTIGNGGVIEDDDDNGDDSEDPYITIR